MSYTTNGSLLRLTGVNTYYGQMHILQDAELHVDAGELVCLLGGNASGKSTTLKTILGIVRPRTGRVLLSGDDGRPDPRPDVREDVRILGNLVADFDFSQQPRAPLLLRPRPAYR